MNHVLVVKNLEVKEALEIRPYVRRSDEFGNVSFRYGNCVWSRALKGDEQLADAVRMLERVKGLCLWIDGRPVTTS